MNADIISLESDSNESSHSETDYELLNRNTELELEELSLEEKLINAEKQWQESLEQLSHAINWLLLPLLGKYMGRKFARIVWSRVAGLVW